MDLSPLGRRNVKIISAAPGEHTSDVARRLDAAWPLSTRWVAQPRLTSPPQGEAVWWGFRGADGRAWGALAFERWKYPRAGGTGCWVEIANDPQLNEQGTKLLALLRFRGTCELPFLQDSEGNWQLLELNPRPWLQVGLAERAGLPVVYATYLDMLEVAAEAFSQPLRPMGWVSPERLLAAALSGEYGPRHRAMAQALAILARAECRVPYDSPQPGVRRRWVGMLIEKGLRNWLG